MDVTVPDGVVVRKVDGGMTKVQDTGTGGFGLYATKAFVAGDDVFAYPSEEWPKVGKEGPYAQTVDLRCSHQDPSLDCVVRVTPLEHGELYADGSLEISGFDALSNHSCDANMYYDEARAVTVACKEICPGDPLTVNYCATNWDESSNMLAFDCVCGSDNCVGRVIGMCQLPAKQQWHLFNEGGVSAYTRDKWFESILEATKETDGDNFATVHQIASILQKEVVALRERVEELEEAEENDPGGA